MEFNKANQNEVDISGIMGQNQGGGSATMITGPAASARMIFCLAAAPLFWEANHGGQSSQTVRQALGGAEV